MKKAILNTFVKAIVFSCIIFFEFVIEFVHTFEHLCYNNVSVLYDSFTFYNSRSEMIEATFC